MAICGRKMEKQRYATTHVQRYYRMDATARTIQWGDGMSRLDQVIADITYVRSCLKLLKTIQESGDCNICKKKRTCEYVPKLGEQVRYNCPFFESEVTE